jgi:hypothetical protein
MCNALATQPLVPSARTNSNAEKEVSDHSSPSSKESASIDEALTEFDLDDFLDASEWQEAAYEDIANWVEEDLVDYCSLVSAERPLSVKAFAFAMQSEWDAEIFKAEVLMSAEFLQDIDTIRATFQDVTEKTQSGELKPALKKHSLGSDMSILASQIPQNAHPEPMEVLPSSLARNSSVRFRDQVETVEIAAVGRCMPSHLARGSSKLRARRKVETVTVPKIAPELVYLEYWQLANIWAWQQLCKHDERKHEQ